MNETVKKRITVRLENPNPLFEKWLTEWKEDAKSRGSKMERTFNFALSNLRKFRIPLASGKECKILKGFGDKLCKMLDDKLAEHNLQGGNSSQTTGTPKKNVELPNLKSPKSSSKEYVPQYKSGGYAILITLHQQWPESLSKEEIIHLGKHFSNTSFLKPDPGSFYTAWSSMKTLLEKGLVTKHGRPIKYSLTDKGYSLAKRLAVDSPSKCHEPLSETASTSSAKENLQKISKGFTVNRKETNSSNYLSKVTSEEKDSAVIEITDDCNEDNFQEYLCFNEGESERDKYLGNNIELPSLETLQRIIPQSNHETVTLNSLSTFQSTSSYQSQSTNSIKITKPMTKCVTADTLLTHNINENLAKGNLKKCSSSSSIKAKQSSVQHEQYIFEPNSFDVILLVDIRETSGSTTDIEDDPLLSKLRNSSILYEVKHLNIGDFVWISRHRLWKKELVLPYIVERKRLDDFASSIKDGRYHEQKFRLKKSGIQNITYLIENFNKHVGLPITTLHQAAANTAIQDGFTVKFTANLRHTVKFLENFSSLLYRNFKDKTLISCPKENISDVNITDELVSLMTFAEFNKASSKNKPLKVSDLFVKMLIQIKGMSVEKACAIVEKYPTPALLKKEYNNYAPSQGEKLLAKIMFGKYNKTIGPVLSKIVYDLFTKETF